MLSRDDGDEHSCQTDTQCLCDVLHDEHMARVQTAPETGPCGLICPSYQSVHLTLALLELLSASACPAFLLSFVPYHSGRRFPGEAPLRESSNTVAGLVSPDGSIAPINGAIEPRMAETGFSFKKYKHTFLIYHIFPLPSARLPCCSTSSAFSTSSGRLLVCPYVHPSIRASSRVAEARAEAQCLYGPATRLDTVQSEMAANCRLVESSACQPLPRRGSRQLGLWEGLVTRCSCRKDTSFTTHLRGEGILSSRQELNFCPLALCQISTYSVKLVWGDFDDDTKVRQVCFQVPD
ncbi:unnamed protein product [Protopolystoma xenopodis]|uniref:Uncharacterized protein n=1 Tax=Protopolystoma xenopodis TaxID=117903 RepID=A0A3S5B9K9_9PLAT|nr:unnamed protein product [Protopolystoma xenopodis]